MDWKNDYEALHKLLEKIVPEFSRYAINSKKYTLDFEYAQYSHAIAREEETW